MHRTLLCVIFLWPHTMSVHSKMKKYLHNYFFEKIKMILSSSSKLHNPPDHSAHPIFDPNLLHFGHDWPSFGCYTTKGTTSGAILRPSSKLCITCQMARSNFAKLRPRMVLLFFLLFQLAYLKALNTTLFTISFKVHFMLLHALCLHFCIKVHIF